MPKHLSTWLMAGPKIYGPIMLSHAFANWKLERTNLDLADVDPECNYCYQPLFLLNKVNLV